jgi:hypothetical protein
MFVIKALKEETKEKMKSNKINKHKTDRNSALIQQQGGLSILVDSCRYWTETSCGETARSRYQSDISQDTILSPGNFSKLKLKKKNKKKNNRRQKVGNCSQNPPSPAFYSYLHLFIPIS